MSDRPILFSAPMVRALLDGRKTQTRRVLKPQPYPLDGRPGYWNASGCVGGRICVSDRALLDLHRKPKIGDRLWVRESWKAHSLFEGTAPRDLPKSRIFYLADPGYSPSGSRGRPGIHMPRWASRFTLIVEDVRVQRLQDVSEEDAIAEGIGRSPHGNRDHWMDYPEGSSAAGWESPRDSYRSLWTSINGSGSWDANPWVAAYTFTVHQQNIDGGAP